MASENVSPKETSGIALSPTELMVGSASSGNALERIFANSARVAGVLVAGKSQ